jgi:hypothetical protein
MLAAMIDGEDDSRVLADLAKSKLRRKIPQLTEALIGTSMTTTPVWPARSCTDSTWSRPLSPSWTR